MRGAPGDFLKRPAVFSVRSFPRPAYVVLLGINLTVLRSVKIVWKIWFKPVIGCEAEMQLLLPPVAV